MTPTPSLKITYRRGKPFAAYLYLEPPKPGQSVRCEELGHGLVADFGSDGRVLGVEITDPALVTPDIVNAALERLAVPAMAPDELRPLAA